MADTKKLRFFAGPNGSRKSTLFEVIAAQFSTGLFVNSDVIEYAISQWGFINSTSFGLKLTQADLKEFYLFPASVTLLLPALQLCDTSFLFDNSSQNMRLIAKVEKRYINNIGRGRPIT